MAFVASPGDLPAEREALRRAAQSVNDTVGRRFGLSLVVEGWEQVQPALGRPQSVINPRVDDCDVFVGLLNRRWGTPTGEYSSGFEEEFERALRRADGPGPSVALFFKRLTVDDTSDPGPQMQQVLGFQQRVRDERTALYESFATTDEFEIKIQSFLAATLPNKPQKPSSHRKGLSRLPCKPPRTVRLPSKPSRRRPRAAQTWTRPARSLGRTCGHGPN